MRILIVAATEKEVNLVIYKANDVKKTGTGLYSGKWGNLDVDFLITGIGLVSTVHKLSLQLAKCSYGLAINAGIAGSFRSNYRIGSVVNVVKEQFGDLGIDDNGEFRSLFDVGYIDKNNPPFVAGTLANSFDTSAYKLLGTLHKVNAISVNKASGEIIDIEKKLTKFQPDIESMEGAGFFYVCLSMAVPFVQLRAISNYVAPRDPKSWNIPMAIMALGDNLAYFLTEISEKQ